jgi:hypothetical protein
MGGSLRPNVRNAGPKGVSRKAISTLSFVPVTVSTVIVYAVVDDALSCDFPHGDSLEVFIRSEDAERFVEEVWAILSLRLGRCGDALADLAD